VTGSGANYTVTVTYKESGNGSAKGDTLGLNFKSRTTVVDDEGNVASEATGAQFSSLAPAGVSGEAIDLALSSAGPNAFISMTIQGVPADWTFDDGTKNSDGSWSVETNDPASLAITPLTNFVGSTVITVNETWTNADGSIGNASIADNVEAYAPGSPIFAVSDNDTLTGAGANDEFVFAQPIGNDSIYNFNPGSDTIDLIGFVTYHGKAVGDLIPLGFLPLAEEL